MIAVCAASERQAMRHVAVAPLLLGNPRDATRIGSNPSHRGGAQSF